MDKELEEYIHLASHELKGPLRKAKTFGELLKSKSSNSLDEESGGYLNRMMKNIDLMQSLLDGLSEYIMCDVENQNEICDLNKVLDQAIHYFDNLPDHKKPTFTKEKLPEIPVNKPAIKEVFKAIIDNSIKFHTPGKKVQIKITCDELTEEEKVRNSLEINRKYFKIAFADNGIGVQKEDCELIFKPFVQLHGRSAYEGNGLGLAICKKIIKAHNGIIYASVKEFGCCITLILPLSGQ